MRKSLKKSLIYLIMTMLVLPTWLVTGIMSAQHAKAGEIINEGFDAYEGNQLTVPTDWVFSGGISSYVGAGNYGEEKPSVAFTASNSSIVTPVFSQADTLSFWRKGMQSGENGTLDVKYLENGTWEDLSSIAINGSTPVLESFSLSLGASQIKFIYTKAPGNIALDDVKISIDTYPELNGLSFENDKNNDGNYEAMDGNIEDGFNLYVDGSPLTEYGIRFSAATQPSEVLKDEMFELKLIDKTVSTPILEAYYENKPEPYRSYLIKAAKGEKPFALIDGATVKLCDAARYDNLPNQKLDMAIPGDYPTGEYTVSGNIEDLTGNKTTVTLKLIISNLALDLEAAKGKIEGLNEVDYTSEAWDRIITAQGRSEESNDDMVYKIISINEAIENLVFAGKADLEAAIADADGKIQSDYTLASWMTLSTALELAETTNAEVLAKTAAINSAIAGLSLRSVPVITTTKIESGNDRSIRIEWQGIGDGATKYEIYLNGVMNTDNTFIVSSIDDSNVKYMKEIKVLNTGTYNVYVKAYRGTEMVQSATRLVEFIAPTPVATVEEPIPAPAAVSVAPARAQAAAPVVEQKIETEEDDSNGQIKGDETSGDEEEKINWTPWIVLFVLILLAGAATGGYFYWFAGEEEVKAVVKTPTKEEKKEKVETTVKAKQPVKKSNKKAKRW